MDRGTHSYTFYIVFDFPEKYKPKVIWDNPLSTHIFQKLEYNGAPTYTKEETGMTAKTIYSKISALRTQPETAQPVRTPAPSPLAVLAESGIHLPLAAVLAGAGVFG